MLYFRGAYISTPHVPILVRFAVMKSKSSVGTGWLVVPGVNSHVRCSSGLSWYDCFGRLDKEKLRGILPYESHKVPLSVLNGWSLLVFHC